MDLQVFRRLLQLYFSTIYILGANACTVQLLESIPEGLNYPPGSPKYPSTYDGLMQLMNSAQKKIDIAMYYWTLRGADTYNHSSAWQGESIFQSLIDTGTKRGIKIRVVQEAPTDLLPNHDTELLKDAGAIELRSVDMAKLYGGGLFHPKLWLIDDKHMYFGSANCDWRSLTQVKELGVLISNCPVLVEDVYKIFYVYWDLAKHMIIPKSWPKKYSTNINALNPIPITFTNGFTMKAYFASAPPELSPHGRTDDIDAILDMIKKADKFIYICLMDYIPMSIYSEKRLFYPIFDDALRSAAIDRKIPVKLLVSSWMYSRSAIDFFLNSLKSVSDTYPGVNIQVRRFVMPTTEDQAKIPLARVNHNKIMVTEKAVWMSNSNWSADYFTDTSGISLVMEDVSTNNTVDTVRKQCEDIFERDWNSDYVVDVESPILPEEADTDAKQSSSACEISKHSIGIVLLSLAVRFLRR